ncbi:MAG: bifunctional diaminohydroxyphosphoribosylaminopyrimidine deaminase/5-amino-6-(5-phosphoribosylamino)uracil reductase RibD [Hydrogenophaga sp.]|nr:bifunctional diaminohydroxyphosphoribosylaminopyrimidine deaminase/5-amino-6-(5-phosphoribosylamino)uracil reductase RibD [Hydrogenophaga sp.]MDP2016246.1 bifunctional diaminohydroxyphosphoribosylaminopyrimidine deaminase/5-amino-6-(5-phosphoribosylamino)uracil reductase RibD [Hydrogenophaga sp.]MDP3164243.1 bifunctional diaminohydroxyphosphoribosylaminopyrimidine deaminase/5-amino-6-(5-phosphoribosylamino)uracil reductase RibD [Hydrogenophaga sp.]MDP3811104.1 bifunctional diaminohydroxyphosp
MSNAARSIGLSEPNPRVACRIVTREGTAFDGHTQQAGGPHAEIVALRAAQSAGADVRGATVQVSLEPCSHHGRTSPCCDALVEAQVAKVVVAVTDPNPLVAGRGLARLQAAGIEVQLLPPDSEAARASRELNIGFFSRMIRGTPWVRMKVATSLDGTSALGNGESQWITGENARADGHAWRARACAVLTGIGTVLQDDPRLDVRLPEVSRQPHLVVVDSDLNTPLAARLFEPVAGGLPRQVWIYHAALDPKKQVALQERGALLTHMPGASNKVDLHAMLRDLGKREVNELHVEAGHKLNGSLLREGLVDELLVYLAPRLLGSGAGMSSFGPLQRLQDGIELNFTAVDRMGDDLRILAQVQGREAFLRADQV